MGPNTGIEPIAAGDGWGAHTPPCAPDWSLVVRPEGAKSVGRLLLCRRWFEVPSELAGLKFAG